MKTVSQSTFHPIFLLLYKILLSTFFILNIILGVCVTKQNNTILSYTVETLKIEIIILGPPSSLDLRKEIYMW